jgi:hypothetical protein
VIAIACATLFGCAAYPGTPYGYGYYGGFYGAPYGPAYTYGYEPFYGSTGFAFFIRSAISVSSRIPRLARGWIPGVARGWRVA